MSDFAISLQAVSRNFGSKVAVDDLDMEIPFGRVTGLVGHNGSGKTTTIRMALGLIKADSGDVRLLGSHPSDETRKRTGYMPENRGVYENVRLLELLTWIGRLHGMGKAKSKASANEWLERFGLGDKAQSPTKGLSKGMLQKVQFIVAAIHDPDLLILDEPFNGLDPLAQETMEQVLKERTEAGGAVILSTHLLEQAERIIDDIFLMGDGKCRLQGSLREIKKQYGTSKVLVRYEGADEWLKIPSVTDFRSDSSGTELTLAEGASPHDILRAAVADKVELTHFEQVLPTLHEIVVGQMQENQGDAGFNNATGA